MRANHSKIADLRAQTSSDYRQITGLTNIKENLEARVKSLERFQDVVDTMEFINQQKEKANNEIFEQQNLNKKDCNLRLAKCEEYRLEIVKSANKLLEEIKTKIEKTTIFLENHHQTTLLKIEKEAQELLGEYYLLANEKQELKKLVQALENKIKGYGDEYLIPNQTILNDLIDGYDHVDAAQYLKSIREKVKSAIKENRVAECDYVEDNRKNTAIAFITNAFNGKADAHLARIRHDNVGKIVEAVKEDYLLLNNYGQAFRNARITSEYLNLRLEEIKWAALVQEFKVREREEQREIREMIREEERARKEYERAMKEAEKDALALQKAYEKARKEFELASDDQKLKYDEKLKELTEKLKVAEEKSQRAISMAQQTRAGHVYIISNIGSFGEDVLKLGMTRRLEPMDRIRELGDASVPFTFDVHAMIYSDDAPTLERKLHHYFNHQRVNKVNYRKEFFRVGLNEVKEFLESENISAKFTLKAEALQYRESLRIEALPDDEQRELEDRIEKIELNNPIEIELEEG
ncbi:DUF4041 domain-containing protein [Acinetobacter sp. B51(2017)]|uniref:DUF4041 domain-containing protein n=1 Tax=Acinetobacter sp. B51(2017) TaxID=2060938 RepID=UPI000F08AF84|nr:DUF4041 domain-containing protein [Acinetobacter sp. B51(2017)]